MSLYLGTSPIAGTLNLEDVVDVFYPVGSVYIGTTATCPLAAVKGTWELQSSAIVTSVDTNVPCKGDGKGLGMTNGSSNFGLAPNTSSNAYMTGWYNLYGQNVGINHTGNYIASQACVGVTTDASKSGIVGTVTRSTLSVNIWKRTA